MPRNRILRPDAVRGLNSAAVLQLLRRHDSLSRAELARHSGLSEGTVSRIMAELMERRLVREDGAENSTGGRPATRLRLDGHKLALGVDIRRWEMRFALANLSGKAVDSAHCRTPASPAATLAMIAARYRAYAKTYGAARLEGIGLSVRGLVNSRTGTVELGNFPEWVRVPAKEILEAELGTVVHIDNNVRLAAIAEHDYGSLVEIHESHCLLFVVVDEGIGIGIVLDGKLYYGPDDAAGEFGQMIIADTGEDAAHNGPGCLERLASNLALCERYAALTGSGPLSGTGDVRARVRRICQRAIGKETAAVRALEETCRYLGIGIGNAIWGLNADAVVIDATINAAWPLVGPLIKRQFPNSPEIINFRRLVPRPSSLGGEGSLIGAAALPFQRVFTTGAALSA